MLISAESINKNDCYHVTQISDDTVEFTTDHGVEYQINSTFLGAVRFLFSFIVLQF